MKIGVMIMILLILQVTIMTFDNTISVDTIEAVPSVYNESGIVNGTVTNSSVSSNIFWAYISNPTRWTNTSLVVYLVAFIAALSVAGITILGSTAISSDTIRFAPIFMVLFGIGSIPLVSFWGVIQREVGAFACAGGALTCWTAWLIPFIIVGPLSAMWFLACFTHWRTGLATS